MKLLITLGGTREPLDAARSITNLSTGRTGSALSDELARRGCRLLCLCAAGAARPSAGGVRVQTFSSFASLDAALRGALAGEAFDAVIHLAAVSDYSPCLIEAGGRQLQPGAAVKIDSSHETLRVTLRRNFKILDRIKGYALAAGRPAPLLVGFKLTSGARPELVLGKVRALAAADLVVHNDLAEMGNSHPFHIYLEGRPAASCEGAAALAGRLYDFIKERTEALCC